MGIILMLTFFCQLALWKSWKRYQDIELFLSAVLDDLMFIYL